MSMEITGLDEVMERLRSASDGTLADIALRRALTVAGKAVQKTAKELVHKGTSQLWESIEVVPLENGVDIGTNLAWGFYEEYGTGKQGDPSVEHTNKDKWSYEDDDGNWHTTSGHEPHPFLFPALEMRKNEIPGIVREELEKAIQGGVG